MKHMNLSVMAVALAACNSVENIDITVPEPEPSEGRPVKVEVLDYSPAPGQFVNILPEYSAGDTKESMRAKAEQSLNNGKVITLGAWGGSVTLKLSEPIENADTPDFRIRGNAIVSGSDADGRNYGSSEPGIVEVMCDDNANGLPDDTWYELKGAMHTESENCVTATYYAAESDASNERYIRWEASDGTSGWINRIASYHAQPYFPQWEEKTASMTFSGRRLPDNARYNESTGHYDLYNWQGYADAYPNDDEKSALDISSAVDEDGHFVFLERIHFIRVTTGVLQVNGPLGECSTELSGVEAL